MTILTLLLVFIAIVGALTFLVVLAIAAEDTKRRQRGFQNIWGTACVACKNVPFVLVPGPSNEPLCLACAARTEEMRQAARQSAAATAAAKRKVQQFN